MEPYLVANSLIGLVAQRLVRKVCPDCAKKVRTTEEDRKILGEDIEYVKEAVGCSKCSHTGYQGRIAVHEIAVIDQGIRKMISEGRQVDEIQDYVTREQGMKTLKESAADLVKEGITTMEEFWKIAYYV